MSTERFSVYQFFGKDGYEQVRELVSAEEAMKAAEHYCTCIAARMGLTTRVIITNNLDEIAFEWQRGRGVTFPPQRQWV